MIFLCLLIEYFSLARLMFPLYSDINDWWRGDGVCSHAGWRLEGEMKEERRKEEKMKEEERTKAKRREDKKKLTQRRDDEGKVNLVNEKDVDRNASTSDNSSLPVSK